MSEPLVIQSHRGPYSVYFGDEPLSESQLRLADHSHFLIDATVARLYSDRLPGIVNHPNAIVIEATEENKSLQGTIPVFESLVANKVRRGHTLVAVGGGIVQDICCFAASTLLRGLTWRFVPTTLLAQADSCIGSKSSINLGDTKNILGTFNPPKDVFVHRDFLRTLDRKDIRSGIGEIIKVHIIEGADTFDALAEEFDQLSLDPNVLQRYIRSALTIKRRFIEADEFDQGIRNVFNYGHSFGHAIESATRYAIPHGIAISIGMDLANYVAAETGLLPRAHYFRMHGVLRKNYAASPLPPISLDAMWGALKRDKKNTDTMLGLILPVGEGAAVQSVQLAPDEALRARCGTFMEKLVS